MNINDLVLAIAVAALSASNLMNIFHIEKLERRIESLEGKDDETN